MKSDGLTCRGVKDLLKETAGRVPDTYDLCDEYTVSLTPAFLKDDKGGTSCKWEELVMSARIKNMSIKLEVRHLRSE